MTKKDLTQSRTVESKQHALVVSFRDETPEFQMQPINVSLAQLSAFSRWLDWYINRKLDEQDKNVEPKTD